MNVTQMRRIDRLVGIPLCIALTGVRRLVDLMRPAAALAEPRRVLILHLSEMGATVLALPALASAKPQTVALNVPTMDCSTCPLTIKAALLKVPGVTKAVVSYKKREAIVSFDDSKATLDDIKKATDDVGYPAMLK